MRKWKEGNTVMREEQIIRKLTKYWSKQLSKKRIKKGSEVEVK